MKKTTISMVLAAAIMTSSCFGSFNAWNGLRDWNDGLTNSKFLDNLVFWGLNIIPVYGLFGLGDLVIFNTIEFWTGSNPIAMKEGDVEKQIVRKNGKKYEITATKNKFSIEVLKGENKGEKMDLVYQEKDQSWNAVTPQGEKVKLSSYKDGFIYVYTPQGEAIKIDANTDTDTGIAMINTFVYANQLAVAK